MKGKFRLGAWFSPVISLIICSFGQPVYLNFLSPFASSVGFAIFWSWVLKKTRPGLYSFIWFFLVQLVQLSWIANSTYLGFPIYAVYILLSLAIGVQFGIISKFIKLDWLSIIGISSCWALMEFSRAYWFSGFMWNPLCLSYTWNDCCLQIVSLFGVFGGSFWIVFTNLSFLRSYKIGFLIALFPYFWGVCSSLYWESKDVGVIPLRVGLFQTFFTPEKRDPIAEWIEIIRASKSVDLAKVDLLVLPEGCIAGGAHHFSCPVSLLKCLWNGFGVSEDFPNTKSKIVDNLFFLQSLTNHFECSLIAGLEDENYCSAFFLTPFQNEKRYEKQILIPVGEYQPISFLKNYLFKRYAISDSFIPGVEPKLFYGKVPLSIAICLEETHSELTRKSKLLGAKLMVGISNIVWVPGSKLEVIQRLHAQIRAAESGMFFLRSSNFGRSSVIDCFGRLVSIGEFQSGISVTEFVNKDITTVFFLIGENKIILFFLLFSLVFFIRRLLALNFL